MPAPQKTSIEKGEAQVSTKYFREWKGIFTKARRVAIPQDNFYDLTNLIPIGHSNVHTIPAISSALVNYSTDVIYWLQYVNINSIDYLILFSSNGKVFAYNISSATSTQINSGNLLSGAGSKCDQWKNSVVVIADSNGYYTWDGTTFTGPITGGTALPTISSATGSGSVGTLLFATSPTTLYQGAVISLTGFTPSGWNGKFAVTIPTLPTVTSAISSLTTGTIIFGSSHGLVSNSIITLTGFTSLGWNATYTATVVNATTITIPFIAPPLTNLPAVTSATAAGTTGTITYSVAHGLVTGQSIITAYFTGSGWNGTFVVTVTSSTVVTITVASGTATATGIGSSALASASILGTITVGNLFTIPTTAATASVIGTALTPGLLPQNSTTPFAQTLPNSDIAVFSNRVWIYSNRALYVSAINSYSDFTLVDGSLVQNLTDPQLRGEANRLYSANGYLYIMGKSSIFVISDVYIPTGANPPAPVFSILNVQAIIGCDQPGSVFTFNRELMFANTYGIYKLSGVTATKISEDIDGTFQYLDTSFPISGGSPQVLNILQASFLIKQLNDPVFGSRVIVANYFEEKWWFANYNCTVGSNGQLVNDVSVPLKFVTTGLNGSIPFLIGIM